MPATRVKSEWVGGDLYFYDYNGSEIFHIDGTNRKLVIPSGSTLSAQGTVTIVDKALEAGDLALTTGSIFLGADGKAAALDMKADGAILIGNGTTAAAKTTSGDVKVANDGAMTIQAKAVEKTMIAAAAGVVLVGTKTSGDVTELDCSAKGAIPVGQGAGETIAAKTMSGDVKMDETGAATIQAKAVESTMIAAAAGTVLIGTKTSGDVTALDNSAEGAIVIGQGAGETCAAAALSGDVKMDKTGAATIQAKAVENTMIAAAAGTILVGTKTSGDVTALDISAEGAMALGQGAGETAAAYAMSGDVTMTKGGVTAIGAAKVTSAMLANGAGLAAVITAGLGNSVSYVKTDDGAKVILADNAAKARGVLVVAVVDEAFADVGGTQTVIEIGEEDTIDKGIDHTILASAAKGAVFCRGFVNTAGKDIIATVSKATGTSTGGASFAVLALPQS